MSSADAFPQTPTAAPERTVAPSPPIAAPSPKGDTGEDHQVGVTWETYAELGKPAGVTVLPRAGEGAVYVCSAYVLGEPLHLPGNRVGTCAGCGGRIQYRPHAPEGVEKVCIACMVSRGVRVPDVSALDLGNAGADVRSRLRRVPRRDARPAPPVLGKPVRPR